MLQLPAIIAQARFQEFFVILVVLVVALPLLVAVIVSVLLMTCVRKEDARRQLERGVVSGLGGTFIGGVLSIAILATTGWTILGPASGIRINTLIFCLPTQPLILGIAAAVAAMRRTERSR